MKTSLHKIIATLSFTALLTGCINPAIINSKKLSNEDYNIQNTLIFIHIPKRYEYDLNNFETTFSSELRNCQIKLSYLYLPTMERNLSLSDDTVSQRDLILNSIKQQNPDSILEISVVSTTFPGEVFNGEYAVTLQKASNLVKVWNGHASVYNAGSADFAKTLIKNLHRDGILNNCNHL
jgi:hypothetical protein